MSGVRTPGGDPLSDGDELIGLALSGGGIKAALFHIGVLARLAEIDLLRRLDVISGTSGGALIAALYHLRLKRALDADGDVNTDRLIRMVAAIEHDFLKVVQTDFRAKLAANPLANLRRTRAGQASSERLGDLLERQLLRPVWNGDPDRPIEWRDLAIHPRGDRDFNPITDNPKRFCKVPSLIVGATNLGTGRAWRFDSKSMGEPAPRPSARRFGRAPLLAPSAYRRLPEAHAGMTLGRAVAASMARPGMLEPLRLRRLYPDPERPGHCLDIRLADGALADALGTEPLLEHGCGRLIVSDGSGIDADPIGPGDSARERQLEALEAEKPGGVVLIHLESGIEAAGIQPLGPIEKDASKTGLTVKIRADGKRIGPDVTSYGVERRLQRLIASMRADLDAPSDIEAMSLMADGYLIAKRAFQRLRQRGQTWADGLPPPPSAWRFTAMIDALRQPPKTLVKHLTAAKRSSFKAPRLAMSSALALGALALAGMLALVALGAVWSAIRPAGGLWPAITTGLLMLAAWLAGRNLGKDEASSPTARPKNAAIAWTDRVLAIAMALPLALSARFERHASRAFLRAGRLKSIGIEPVKADTRKNAATEPRTADLPPERKAA